MPVWLLAMEKDYCAAMHVVGHSLPKHFLKTMRERNIDPHLVNIAVARLGLRWLHYLGTESPPHKAVLLVSVSMDFLKKNREQWPRHPGLFLLDQPSRSKVQSHASMKWSITTKVLGTAMHSLRQNGPRGKSLAGVTGILCLNPGGLSQLISLSHSQFDANGSGTINFP
jgi:hypothetical protein